MIKAATLFVIIVICFSCNNRTQTQPPLLRNTVNFESVDAYFSLMDRVAQGDTITDAVWERFLALEGNRLYIEENNISTRSLDLIRSEMELAYHPENDSLLQSKLGNDIRLQIRKRYQTQQRNYRNHIELLKINTSVLQDSALQLTRQYLPEAMHALDTFPNIYLHGLWDGSASDKGIFVDVIMQYDFDQKRLGSFIAHELHHFMLSSAIDTEQLQEADAGAIWAVQSIQGEGLADMVDKSALVFEGSDWWLNEQYMALLNYANQVLEGLNGFLEDEYNGLHHTETEYREVLANSVGHIPGQYMAQVIQDNGGLTEVINQAENPFSMFYIYNSIASIDNAYPAFSENAIAHLKSLEQRYVQAKNQ